MRSSFADNMKTKRFLALVVTLVVGIVLGVIGSRFVTHMNAYARVSMHAIQGRAIMQQITDYRDANGVAPDQQ
jgi:type II secretory pathway pseudopilin PulG